MTASEPCPHGRSSKSCCRKSRKVCESMERVEFIREITQRSKRSEREEIGNCIFFRMKNGNVAKAYCVSNAATVEIISRTEGMIDCVELPFANYFAKKKCSPGAPEWDQHIENGRWYFDQYPHCCPTNQDYMAISAAVDKYIGMME